MHHKGEKSGKFYLFKIINWTKIVFLGLFLSITRYYPQIWSIFCYIQLVLLVLPQKKWCELGANPKKSHFSPIFGRYLKYAKNRGEPQKMTPSSETEFFLGWSEWENCCSGYTYDMPCWQKSRLPYKKTTKNDANKVPRWFLHYVRAKTFASSRKNSEFWPK